MKHSCANVFWSRFGERRGPVKNGERIEWVSTRSLLTAPVPPHLVPTHPRTYDGAALLPLLNEVGAGGVARGSNAADCNPRRAPVTTLPGVPYPGRPPSTAFHVSQSQAMIVPASSSPTRW